MYKSFIRFGGKANSDWLGLGLRLGIRFYGDGMELKRSTMVWTGHREPRITVDSWLTGDTEAFIDSWKPLAKCIHPCCRLKGFHIYDMWMRISANKREDTFDLFLCYNEGPFGDCLPTKSENDAWPGGDDAVPEGEEEEQEVLARMTAEQKMLLLQMDMGWRNVYNAASSRSI